MPTVLRTDISTILDAIITRLVAKEVVPSAGRVIVSADPDNTPHYDGETDVLLAPGEESSDGGDEGAGRHDTRAITRLSAVVRSRCELDESGQDRLKLLHATLGHFLLRKSVRDALHIFWPVDVDTNDLYSVQPMRWKRTSAPKRDRKDVNWISSVIDFEIVYMVDLDQADQ